MNTFKSKKHIWIGAGILLIISLVLGWFVGRYIPGTPQSPKPNTASESYPGGYLTSIPISDVIYIPFNTTKQLEGISRGDKYTVVDANLWPDLEEEAYKVDPEAEGYIVEYPSFEIIINEAKVIPSGSFVDWFPDYDETYLGIGSLPGSADPVPESKMVLIDVTVTNLSKTQSLNLADVQLGSDVLTQAHPGRLGNGYGISGAGLECLNGLPRVEAGDYPDMSYLTSFEPGEKRTLTLPYLVLRNAFLDGNNFDELDLSQFNLEIYDYDPATIYRFQLG